MTDYIPSFQNWQLCRGDFQSVIDTTYNAGIDDSIARQYMYNVPLCNFNNNRFINFADCNYPTPWESMAKHSWGQGWGFYQQDGEWTFKFPSWNNGMGVGGWNAGFGMNPWSNMGWTPGATPSKSDKEGETAADKDYNRKHAKLLALVKQLVEHTKLSDSIKDELDVAMKTKSGEKPEDKYNRLKEAYDKIDKAIVEKFLKSDEAKQFLTEAIKDKYVSASSGTHEKSFYAELLGTGFEYKGTDTDDALLSLEQSIEGLADNGGEVEGDTILGHLNNYVNGGNTSYPILDVISSWNTAHRGTEKRNIISFIAKEYAANKQDSEKKDIKDKALTPIVMSLVKTAENYTSELDTESKEALETAIKNVKKSLDNVKTDKNATVPADLATNFDNLYVLTRAAATAVLQNKVNATYNDIDSKVFDNELFMNDMKKDLKEEGLTTDVNVKVSEENQELEEANKKKKVKKENNAGDTPKTAQEEINALVANGSVVELKVKYADADKKEYTVYEEAQVTGDRDYKRLFIIKDDKVVVLENRKLKDGKITEVKEGVATKYSAVDPDDIEEAVEEANDKIEKEEEEKAAKEAKEKEIKELKDKYDLSKEEIKDANKIGKVLKKRLCGNTNEDNWDEIVGKMSDITPENVIYVLANFKANGWNSWNWSEVGFFGQTVKEYNDQKAEVMETMRGHIKTYIEDQIKILGKDNPKTNELQKLLDTVNSITFTETSNKVSKGEKENAEKMDRVVRRTLQILDI